jgi:hypothetical protein
VSDRAQLGEIVRRVRDGRLRTNIGTIATLDDAVAAFNPTERISGKTIIHVRASMHTVAPDAPPTVRRCSTSARRSSSTSRSTP